MKTAKDKLIEKQKELILFYEKKLSVGEINSAYDYKKQMFLLESELAKEQEPDKTLSFREFLTNKAIFTWSEIDLIEKLYEEYINLK